MSKRYHHSNRTKEKKMAINPMKLMQLKSMWDKFQGNHPKFPLFLKAASQKGMEEGSVIAITITTPEGKDISSNIKLTASDMELVNTLKENMN